jgi:hypothetical protein
MATGKDLVGNWSFNANGSRGGMTIFNANDGGAVALRVGLGDDARQEKWDATWLPAERKIILDRHLPTGATQRYTGYLGDNNPPNLAFGGSFVESELGDTQFGWSAEWLFPILG